MSKGVVTHLAYLFTPIVKNAKSFEKLSTTSIPTLQLTILATMTSLSIIIVPPRIFRVTLLEIIKKELIAFCVYLAKKSHTVARLMDILVSTKLLQSQGCC